MRVFVSILLLFLSGLNGCTSRAVLSERPNSKAEHTVIIDETESNLVNLYSAAADTRNAVQQEAASTMAGFGMRVLPGRTRTHSSVSIRQVLLSTHRPMLSTLIHNPFIQLVAFPKEYHVFQLRRILI